MGVCTRANEQRRCSGAHAAHDACMQHDAMTANYMCCHPPPRRQSINFYQAYTAAPICTPSRGAMQTGRMASRLGLTSNDSRRVLVSPAQDEGLASEEVTMAEGLKDAGYATGLVSRRVVPPLSHAAHQAPLSWRTAHCSSLTAARFACTFPAARQVAPWAGAGRSVPAHAPGVRPLLGPATDERAAVRSTGHGDGAGHG